MLASTLCPFSVLFPLGCVCILKVLLKSTSKSFNNFFLILEKICSGNLGDFMVAGKEDKSTFGILGEILSVTFHELLRESCIQFEAITSIL